MSVGLFGIIVSLFIGAAALSLWFLVTHKCIESHQEQQMRTSCSTISGHTDCHTYPITVTVCDQWVRR